jgi:hypothetical protein
MSSEKLRHAKIAAIHEAEGQTLIPLDVKIKEVEARDCNLTNARFRRTQAMEQAEAFLAVRNHE